MQTFTSFPIANIFSFTKIERKSSTITQPPKIFEKCSL